MEKIKENKAALIVGCGGIGGHITAELRCRAPRKKLYVADIAVPPFASGQSGTEFIQVDLFKDGVEKLSGLDIDTLIFSAGIGRLSRFSTFTAEEIEKNFSVNCVSAIKLIRYYYGRLASAEDFYCAVITSVAGMVASPLYSVYSATKGALVKFIEAVNAELEHDGFANRILDIAPGYIGGTAFHGAVASPEEEARLAALSEMFVTAMQERRAVCIPDYDKTYSRVLASYHADPAGFALGSMDYKLKGGALNDRPQVKVGYLTGTFDLFHVGHLNLLRNAKKYCDKLIVGIHPDGSHKNKEVFIPLDERMDIVRNIKYVDEVMVCSAEDTDAWPQLRYDYLFVGSDYKGTERFARYEEYLSQRGAKVIYLPYTQKTSSTQLRSIISGRIAEDDK